MNNSIKAAAPSHQIDIAEWESFFFERVKRRRRLVYGYIAYLRQMAARDLPPIFEDEHLALLLGIHPQELAIFTLRPDLQYRSFSILKKNGGERPIRVPWPRLLACQRWISTNILARLPVHSAAHGYVEKHSNITNAAAHLGNRQVLCVDITDFFGSITGDEVKKLFLEAGYPENVAALLTKLCTLANYLPQGAASSPALSNLIMHRVDSSLHEYCTENGLVYTRYVDDISVSGEVIRGVHLSHLERILLAGGFQINKQKTRFQRSKRKIVTGLSIGSGSIRLPRSLRREFRNDAVIALRAANDGMSSMIEHDPIRFERVLGKLSYWSQVEPSSVIPVTFTKDIRRALNIA
jgi:retron-type reverse transcriptase